MGLDSAIECVNDYGKVKVFTSVTRAIPNNFGARRSDIVSRNLSSKFFDRLHNFFYLKDQNIIRLKESKVENGAIYCLVERDAVTKVDDMTFDLENQEYHLLIASGSTVGELSIGYHDINRGASTHAVWFTAEMKILRAMSEQTSKALVIIHGSFMIVAWIGATSIGVSSSRYLKQLWIGKKLFGKDIWFTVHQVSMSLMWLLIILSIIIIWVDDIDYRISTHSILGVIATILCFTQPLTAYYRPAPDDSLHPFFNIVHGFTGRFVHFLAGNLKKILLHNHLCIY